MVNTLCEPHYSWKVSPSPPPPLPRRWGGRGGKEEGRGSPSKFWEGLASTEKVSYTKHRRHRNWRMAAAEKDPTPDRKRPRLSSSMYLLPPASSTSHSSFTSSTSRACHDRVCCHSFWSGTKCLFWYRAGFWFNYEKPWGGTIIV